MVFKYTLTYKFIVIVGFAFSIIPTSFSSLPLLLMVGFAFADPILIPIYCFWWTAFLLLTQSHFQFQCRLSFEFLVDGFSFANPISIPILLSDGRLSFANPMLIQFLFLMDGFLSLIQSLISISTFRWTAFFR